MNEVIRALQSSDLEKRIIVLRLELDYELAKLYEAMEMNEPNEMDQSKARLQEIRDEMIQLEAW